MTSKSLVVSGEASETDSEDEGVTPQFSNNMKASMQGAVIAGEDSESENEETASPKATVATKHSPKKIITEENDSLLHRKLQESNRELRKEIEAITNRTIGGAGETLNSVEQELLKSQITLQGALTSLRSLNNNSLCIRNKLQEVLSSKFLSNVSN